MKILSYLAAGEQRFGELRDGRVHDIGTDPFRPTEPASTGTPVGELELTWPLPRPGKIVCVGLNYRDHAAEAGLPVPESPVVFTKFTTSIVGPGADIVLPADAPEKVDWEVELGVVIGHRARDVAEADALDHVFGYTALNDVSARDLQQSEGQWVRCKSFDTFCPMGPAVVTADEVADPQALAVRTRLNGDTVQDSSTSQMVFGVAELVSRLSRDLTLEPGDVIATGTPPGVGVAMDPPRFLRPGDVIEVEVEHVGVLTNHVVAK